MITQGTHRARGVSAEMAESKKKGTEFVRVSFRVEGGDHNGETVNWDGYFTEKTTKRTLESLSYCGCTFPNNDATNFDGIDRNVVDIVVEHEPWVNDEGEEKIQVRVAWVNNPGGLSEEQIMSASKKAAFAQRMKGTVMSLPKPKGASPNAAAKPANGRTAAAAPRNTEGGYEPDEEDPFAP